MKFLRITLSNDKRITLSNFCISMMGLANQYKIFSNDILYIKNIKQQNNFDDTINLILELEGEKVAEYADYLEEIFKNFLKDE